ncbi:hypothetical protein AAG570_006828 [Ranatra chinensis]|uniref:G-protein coupled receptors family 1 profile domain-containing protein n=1 Tax=Ranatra chinensis TaxID=642074 RepID=A0ABD0YVU8_9HEMI
MEERVFFLKEIDHMYILAMVHLTLLHAYYDERFGRPPIVNECRLESKRPTAQLERRSINSPRRPLISIQNNAQLIVKYVKGLGLYSRVTNYFLVNLSVADLLVTLVCMPAAMGQSITGLWILGDTMCKLTSYFQYELCCDYPQSLNAEDGVQAPKHVLPGKRQETTEIGLVKTAVLPLSSATNEVWS